MRYRFRKIVEREEFAATIEVRYSAQPITGPTYLDAEPIIHGGVREWSWCVARLHGPIGLICNPVEIAEAESLLRLEENFEDEIRNACEQDFVDRESVPGRSRK